MVSRRIEQCVGSEGDVDTVESEPRFVDEVRIEDMGLVQCQDLPMSIAMVTEPGMVSPCKAGSVRTSDWKA